MYTRAVHKHTLHTADTNRYSAIFITCDVHNVIFLTLTLSIAIYTSQSV